MGVKVVVVLGRVPRAADVRRTATNKKTSLKKLSMRTFVKQVCVFWFESPLYVMILYHVGIPSFLRFLTLNT